MTPKAPAMRLTPICADRGAVDPGGRHGEGPASHWAVVTRGPIHLGHHLESGKGESQLAAAGARSGMQQPSARDEMVWPTR